MAPTKRASFGMVAHRDRAYLFGGVTDMAGAGDKLYSELHDELFQLDLASQRWRPVAMKLKAPSKVCVLISRRGLLCLALHDDRLWIGHVSAVDLLNWSRHAEMDILILIATSPDT